MTPLKTVNKLKPLVIVEKNLGEEAQVRGASSRS